MILYAVMFGSGSQRDADDRERPMAASAQRSDVGEQVGDAAESSGVCT